MPAPPTIYIAAADKALASSLVFALELEGYVTRAFGSLAELSSERLGANDCIIVDQEVLDAARSATTGPMLDRAGCSIILMTGQPTLLRISQVLGRRPVHFVEKPLLGSVLTDAVRQALARPAP